MKYRILVISFIICFFCGCTNKKDFYIETFIKNDNHLKVSIIYPKTGYYKLDKKISDYVNNYTKSDNKIFLDTLDEVNIDYTYFKNNNIISIVLFKNENDNQEITTYNYDFKKNSFVNISDFIKNYDIIYEYLKKDYNIDKTDTSNLKVNNFSIDHNFLYIYYSKDTFNTDDNLIIKIPLDNKINDVKVSKKINAPIKRNIDTSSKVVALTFDDGPSRYTNDIIDILEENDAVATFFILGNKVKLYEDTLKKSISNGNEIGNHTFNHKWLTKLTDDEIKEQISNTQSIIEEVTGYTPLLFRPSYGSLNKRVRKDINLDIVLWNVDTMDWKYKSTNKIVARATNNVKDMDIILLHDTYKSTKDSLEKIITTLKDKGFTFVTVSELKEIKKLRNER